MTITPSQFTQNFDEFSNATAYPPGAVTFWLNLAYLRLNTLRWGALLDTGAQLYAAHNLVLEYQANRAAKRGAAPGIQKGAVSGESVGPASQSYDTGLAGEAGYGNYNLTTYGTRFAELVCLVGAGPLQTTC